MRRQYMDAMALVQKFGKPDIFLTMTCNPNWDGIKNELYPSHTSLDRLDLVVHVFRCNTLGVWLPLIAFHFISMCIIYVINSIVTETCICNIRTFCLFRICVLMNDSIATYECNINFSYLETWQHGRNMTSVE